MYLSRETNWLHGLALLGVRAVLGIESRRGSPFNVQRSLHVPNLTSDEVRGMYRQYQEESGQPIEPDNALTYTLLEEHLPVLHLEPLDDLADVFAGPQLDTPALLTRYKAYLGRLKAKGLNPWKEQPRRKNDFRLTEAVGHFHLYSWLQGVVSSRCVVSPEFPTGNGKVDLHLKCGKKQSIIEVKSFVDAYQLKLDRVKAAEYAKSLGLGSVTMAVFVPVEDEDVLKELSNTEMCDQVQVTTVAIGWV